MSSDLVLERSQSTFLQIFFFLSLKTVKREGVKQPIKLSQARLKMTAPFQRNTALEKSCENFRADQNAGSNNYAPVLEKKEKPGMVVATYHGVRSSICGELAES